jgi:hypothetical protein
MSPAFAQAWNLTAISAGIIIAAYYILFFIIRFWARKNKNGFAQLFNRHIHFAGLLLCVSIILNIAFTNFRPFLYDRTLSYGQYIVRSLIIISIAFLFIKIIMKSGKYAWDGCRTIRYGIKEVPAWL